MKTLKDFADDINKCSKCGLCQSVCPVYKITGNDCAVSRGKFVMLEGVLKGDLKLNRTIEKYLDMCLRCGKCKDFCPGGIDVCEIFNIAKYEYSKNTLHGKIEKFLESDFVFGNCIKLARKISHFGASRLQPANDGKETTRLLYFKGCVNNIYPKTEKALKKILKKLDVELIERDFDCCGQPFLSGGNLERFEEVKAWNLKLMDCDFDAVLTDCASCESTLREYFKECEAPEFINAAEFLAKQNVRFRFKKPVRVTFHKPCHLKSADFVPELFRKCENVEYIEMKDFDECCGFAGSFALKNGNLSITLAQNKAKNIIETGANVVLTTCPACILGILRGFNHRRHPKVMNVVDFLAQADEIALEKSY